MHVKSEQVPIVVYVAKSHGGSTVPCAFSFWHMPGAFLLPLEYFRFDSIAVFYCNSVHFVKLRLYPFREINHVPKTGLGSFERFLSICAAFNFLVV